MFSVSDSRLSCTCQECPFCRFACSRLLCCFTENCRSRFSLCRTCGRQCSGPSSGVIYFLGVRTRTWGLVFFLQQQTVGGVVQRRSQLTLRGLLLLLQMKTLMGMDCTSSGLNMTAKPSSTSGQMKKGCGLSISIFLATLRGAESLAATLMLNSRFTRCSQTCSSFLKLVSVRLNILRQVPLKQQRQVRMESSFWTAWASAGVGKRTLSQLRPPISTISTSLRKCSSLQRYWRSVGGWGWRRSRSVGVGRFMQISSCMQRSQSLVVDFPKECIFRSCMRWRKVRSRSHFPSSFCARSTFISPRMRLPSCWLLLTFRHHFWMALAASTLRTKQQPPTVIFSRCGLSLSGKMTSVWKQAAWFCRMTLELPELKYRSSLQMVMNIASLLNSYSCSVSQREQRRSSLSEAFCCRLASNLMVCLETRLIWMPLWPRRLQRQLLRSTFFSPSTSPMLLLSISSRKEGASLRCWRKMWQDFLVRTTSWSKLSHRSYCFRLKNILRANSRIFYRLQSWESRKQSFRGQPSRVSSVRWEAGIFSRYSENARSKTFLARMRCRTEARNLSMTLPTPSLLCRLALSRLFSSNSSPLVPSRILRSLAFLAVNSTQCVAALRASSMRKKVRLVTVCLALWYCRATVKAARQLAMESVQLARLWTCVMTKSSAFSRLRQSSSCSRDCEISTMGHFSRVWVLGPSCSTLSCRVTTCRSTASSFSFWSMRARRQSLRGLSKRLTQSRLVLAMGQAASWLSWRQRMRRWGKPAKRSGRSASWLEERSSLISEVHLLTVMISCERMFVPARISSFRLAGSLMNSLICSYYSKLCRILQIDKIINMRPPRSQVGAAVGRAFLGGVWAGGRGRGLGKGSQMVKLAVIDINADNTSCSTASLIQAASFVVEGQTFSANLEVAGPPPVVEDLGVQLRLHDGLVDLQCA